MSFANFVSGAIRSGLDRFTSFASPTVGFMTDSARKGMPLLFWSMAIGSLVYFFVPGIVLLGAGIAAASLLVAGIASDSRQKSSETNIGLIKSSALFLRDAALTATVLSGLSWLGAKTAGYGYERLRDSGVMEKSFNAIASVAVSSADSVAKTTGPLIDYLSEKKQEKVLLKQEEEYVSFIEATGMRRNDNLSRWFNSFDQKSNKKSYFLDIRLWPDTGEGVKRLRETVAYVPSVADRQKGMPVALCYTFVKATPLGSDAEVHLKEFRLTKTGPVKSQHVTYVVSAKDNWNMCRHDIDNRYSVPRGRSRPESYYAFHYKN